MGMCARTPCAISQPEKKNTSCNSGARDQVLDEALQLVTLQVCLYKFRGRHDYLGMNPPRYQIEALHAVP